MIIIIVIVIIIIVIIIIIVVIIIIIIVIIVIIIIITNTININILLLLIIIIIIIILLLLIILIILIIIIIIILQIGLIAQLHTEEDTERCLAAYCRLMNSNYMYRDLDTENVDKTTSSTSSNYFKCPYLSNIRTIEMTHQESRGPEYGRHLQDYLLRDEEFCLQMDSHVQLLPNWDADLISMWVHTNNDYAILSTYPPDASNQYKSGEFPHVCTATFTSSGLVRNMLPMKARNFDTPLLAVSINTTTTTIIIIIITISHFIQVNLLLVNAMH